MDTRLQVHIKDPLTAVQQDLPLLEAIRVEEELLLAGPISGRVAVLDFDPETGRLLPGVPLEDGERPDTFRYRLADPDDAEALDVLDVSVFGNVCRTLQMFEEPDALGRQVSWAFSGPQLLVVPRAGEWANAFYDRASRSLQFFYFRTAGREGEEPVTIYTSRSQDIVAHETAHAVLDGIAPDLYHAITPQALAVHEAVADLAAVLAAFRSRTLREKVLERTGGTIADSRAFSGLAREFATGVDIRRQYLRDLLNVKALGPDAGLGYEPVADRTNPHELSEVLSGALYLMAVDLHESLKVDFAERPASEATVVTPAEATQALKGETGEAAPPAPQGMKGVAGEAYAEAKRRVAGKALAVAAERLKRMVFRGLDYLPPGEISFADFGRAVLAADEASHPDSQGQRTFLVDELMRRAIVGDREALAVETNVEREEVAGLDLEALVHSDWAAYDFANRHREFLRIPPEIPFKLLPRLDVEKRYYHAGSAEEDATERIRECILKVSWTDTEANRLGAAFPERRQVIRGTTLAIDRRTGRVRARLTTDRGEEQERDRDRFLRRLLEEEILTHADLATGPTGSPLHTRLGAEVVDGRMRVRGTARTLHLASPWGGEEA